jgi:GNAT superfamily N-acetyltransferase
MRTGLPASSTSWVILRPKLRYAIGSRPFSPIREQVSWSQTRTGRLSEPRTCFFVPVAHDARPWCRITALVVDTAHRGHGIGRMLVAAAETAARDAGCARIEATSALHRAGAHRLYEGLGFGRTSAHFLKRL